MNARVLCALLVLPLCSCAPRGETGPVPVSMRHPLTDNWILLPEPSVGAGIEVGAAYDLTNLNTGCYTFTSAADSVQGPGNAWETMELRWERLSSDSAFLRVAKLLNLDAALSTADGAYIRLDSVRILRAADVAPAPTCRATTLDGSPVRPAISALIGAKSYTVRAWNRRGQVVTGQLLAKGALASSGGQSVRRAADSAVVSFSSFRWLGAQFMGFEPRNQGVLQPVGPFRLGEIVQVPPRFEVRITRSQGPLYTVHSRSTLPAGRWETVDVEPNELFSIGAPSGSRGMGMNARIRLSPTQDDRIVLLPEVQGYRQLTWIGESQREALLAWIDSRR